MYDTRGVTNVMNLVYRGTSPLVSLAGMRSLVLLAHIW